MPGAASKSEYSLPDILYIFFLQNIERGCCFSLECLRVFLCLALKLGLTKKHIRFNFGKFLFPKYPGGNALHSFFMYKNIFYKNIEAEICEILRNF